MNRIEIKKKARELIKGNIWTILKAVLIVCVVITAFGLIPNLFGIETEKEIITTINGTIIKTTSPTTIGGIYNIIISLISSILSVGVIGYVLKFVRKGKVEIADIFDVFKTKWKTIIVVSILIYIFTTLWTLLFIIPGIFAMLSYSMTSYIIIDNDDMQAMEIIKKSKEMMKGYKGDYFIFCLSFFGWFLLGIITIGIGFIYVIPYVSIANALYYEELKKIRN